MKEPLYRHQEKEQVLGALGGAGVDVGSVHLVCIERAFESWLLFDSDLLSRVLFKFRPTHKKRMKPPANPDTLTNVKGVFIRIFRKYGQRYVDVVWAPRFAAELNDLNRLLRCGTFQRFAERVIGRPL